jgi:hypothetical protein
VIYVELMLVYGSRVQPASVVVALFSRCGCCASGRANEIKVTWRIGESIGRTGVQPMVWLLDAGRYVGFVPSLPSTSENSCKIAEGSAETLHRVIGGGVTGFPRLWMSCAI